MVARLLRPRLQATLFRAVAAVLHAAPAAAVVFAQIQEEPAAARRIGALADTLAQILGEQKFTG